MTRWSLPSSPALLGLLVLGSAAVACTASGEVEDVGSPSDSALWSDARGTWPAGADGFASISVCWETPGFDAQKSSVQDRIRATWEAAARVRFTGWRDCRDGVASDLRIAIADEGARVAAFGPDLRNRRRGVVLNFEMVQFDRRKGCLAAHTIEHCIQSDAVHEFGHVLGFDHEHDRTDAPPTCPDGRELHARTGSGRMLSAYDPASVMNYCAGYPLELSDGDVLGVRRVYGAR